MTRVPPGVTRDHIEAKHAELVAALRDGLIQVERLRGAVTVLEELLAAEAEVPAQTNGAAA